jgi:hypothetical protein
MSRRGAPKGRKPPGTEFTWDADPGGEPDTAPTPLYPVCLLLGLALQEIFLSKSINIPNARKEKETI